MQRQLRHAVSQGHWALAREKAARIKIIQIQAMLSHCNQLGYTNFSTAKRIKWITSHASLAPTQYFCGDFIFHWAFYTYCSARSVMSSKQIPRRPKCNTLPQTSVVILALGFVTLTPSCFARVMISILFLDETAWEILIQVSLVGYSMNACTYSAANVLLCMRRRSTSRTLLTRKALWPEGIMWRVFLLDPKPIYIRYQQVFHCAASR